MRYVLAVVAWLVAFPMSLKTIMPIYVQHPASNSGLLDFPVLLLVFAVPTSISAIIIKIANMVEEDAARMRAAERAERDRRIAEEMERQRLEATELARRQQHVQQQAEYRDQMASIAKQSVALFESLPKYLRYAEGNLDRADVDFEERAFAPYWDSIEGAANALGRLDAGIRQIENHSIEYARLLAKYEGVPQAFPLAPHSLTKLRVSTTSAERLQATVRKAQRDFQFATIYEQRKTNQILIAGFTNLAQALASMTSRIEASIDGVIRAVESTASVLNESMQDIRSRLGDIDETNRRHLEEAVEAASEAAEREEKVLEVLEDIHRRRR